MRLCGMENGGVLKQLVVELLVENMFAPFGLCSLFCYALCGGAPLSISNLFLARGRALGCCMWEDPGIEWGAVCWDEG